MFTLGSVSTTMPPKKKKRGKQNKQKNGQNVQNGYVINPNINGNLGPLPDKKKSRIAPGKMENNNTTSRETQRQKREAEQIEQTRPPGTGNLKLINAESNKESKSNEQSSKERSGPEEAIGKKGSLTDRNMIAESVEKAGEGVEVSSSQVGSPILSDDVNCNAKNDNLPKGNDEVTNCQKELISPGATSQDSGEFQDCKVETHDTREESQALKDKPPNQTSPPRVREPKSPPSNQDPVWGWLLDRLDNLETKLSNTIKTEVKECNAEFKKEITLVKGGLGNLAAKVAAVERKQEKQEEKICDLDKFKQEILAEMDSRLQTKVTDLETQLRQKQKEVGKVKNLEAQVQKCQQELKSLKNTKEEKRANARATKEMKRDFLREKVFTRKRKRGMRDPR